ncbi:histidine phosphatase family protein [Nitriliruptoraceae bacterium ZYF776]|nr:histidine phosphatase family protein [Profundirhabdus halotolerans]
MVPDASRGRRAEPGPGPRRRGRRGPVGPRRRRPRPAVLRPRPHHPRGRPRSRPVTVLLLRHAHAGDRDTWDGRDHLRPLSSLGLKQALAVVDQLAGHPIDRVVTSPYVRCVQSVEPLAAAIGVPVESDDDLAEGAAPDVTRRLLRKPGGRTVLLCSHGDVIGAAVTDLEHRGLLGDLDPRWPKGSTWVLEGPLWPAAGPGGAPATVDDRDVAVSYLAPPA